MKKPFSELQLNNLKKIILIFLGIIIPSFLFSQELNIGGKIGSYVSNNSNPVLDIGAIFEYRPLKSIVSFNADLSAYYYSDKLVMTLPIYVKVIIGDKYRVCPSFGGLIRTNGNVGLISGLSLEMKIKERFLIFIRGDYIKEYWESTSYTHFGTKYSYQSNGSSVWISIGIKRSILN